MDLSYRPLPRSINFLFIYHPRDNMRKKRTKLLSILKKHLLLQNNELPPEKRAWWMSSVKLHRRLIHAGVDPSLKLEVVQDAIRRLNRDEKYLATRDFDNV